MYLRTVLLISGIGACSFDTGGIAAGGDGPSRSVDDAGSSEGREAAIGDAGAADAVSQCSWPFRPVYVDPCSDSLAPGASLELADAEHVYDTDQATLSATGAPATSPPSKVVEGVRIVWTEGFAVRETASLRVVGSMPLMVVSTGPITVSGTIDVASFDDGGGAFSVGAGASVDSSTCGSPPQAGIRCSKHGASGGGGGGFAAAGSGGDSGGVSHDCGDENDDGKPPTTGGAAIVGVPTRVRAGCAGAAGDFATEGGASAEDRGKGGPGGGAIHLVSGSTLIVDGLIHAGGAGGTPGTDHRASGGGGGSGGYIGLEANDLRVMPAAILAANGGAGGGGCDNPTGLRGADGKPSGAVAAGGQPQGSGGRGNDGGYLAVAAEAPGVTVERGGGGGGGGVGFILFHAANQISVQSGADISPPWIRIP